MGQVRDLTPLREADGRLVALPAVEDAITACLDAIRNIQAQRPPEQAVRHQPDHDVRLAVDRAVHRRAERAGRSASCRPRRARAWRRSSSWPGSATAAGELTEVAVRITPRPGPRRAPARRRAVDRAGAAAGRLPAEGAARRPARQRLPVRADRPARRAGGRLRRARPRRRTARSCRWTGRRGRNSAAHRGGRGHARRPSGTRRASPAWCCSATRRRRWARCRSRSAPG